MLTAEGISPRFLSLLESEPLAAMSVLDVATGQGRLALALAPHCRNVIGIDREPSLIDEARRRAQAAGLANIAFTVADADHVDFTEVLSGRPRAHPDMVTAHLYLSDTLVAKASQALLRGGVLACVGFHADQWRETGRRSRFAYDEDQMARVLDAGDFAVEHLEVERDVRTFASLEAALAAVVALEDRWRADGRWFRYIAYLEEGGRQLTRAALIVKARRR
ncbi:MAG TPA: class I SAM-dependent methyltransferase [Methylomirabilota bacterium]|nr:class I SAM-dependent methyltransferase [Methylomirabilota bacterium]